MNHGALYYIALMLCTPFPFSFQKFTANKLFLGLQSQGVYKCLSATEVMMAGGFYTGNGITVRMQPYRYFTQPFVDACGYTTNTTKTMLQNYNLYRVYVYTETGKCI